MEERLTEERTWSATANWPRYSRRNSALVVTPEEAVRQHLHSMGYSWKRTRYVPNERARPRRGTGSPRGTGGPKKGRPKAEIVLEVDLDQSGFYLCLTSHEHLDGRKGKLTSTG